MFKKLTNNIAINTLLTIATISFGCSGEKIGTANGPSATGSTNFQGSGSSFVKPMMDKWTSEYGKVNAGMKIDYTATGSGAGIKAIQNQTADFGATDAAMSDEEMKGAAGEIVHIPVVLGAVVLTYNLEGVKDPLKLTPELISDIYQGKIKTWNDAAIKKENPGVALPADEIIPVFRADGSGTSDVFTDIFIENGSRVEGKDRPHKKSAAAARSRDRR